MKKLILLLALLSPSIARANTVTPQFTTGSMTSTTTTQQTINSVEVKEVYGSEVFTWSGNNVTPSADIVDTTTTFSVTDDSLPWNLETTYREAGLVELWTTTTEYDIQSTTNSLSVFSQ